MSNILAVKGELKSSEFSINKNGSIVTKNVASNSVVAGVPARVICTIDDFYKKNKDRFYPSLGLEYEEKKKMLTDIFDEN